MPEPETQCHLLYTPTTCPYRDDRDHENRPCAICDAGLSICSLCGKAEIELREPCTGKKEVANV